jgi:hypothetical protein
MRYNILMYIYFLLCPMMYTQKQQRSAVHTRYCTALPATRISKFFFTAVVLAVL